MPIGLGHYRLFSSHSGWYTRGKASLSYVYTTHGFSHLIAYPRLCGVFLPIGSVVSGRLSKLMSMNQG